VRHTKHCVYCGERAAMWCGHVLRDGKPVIAGWCEKHSPRPDGFVGHFKKWMGELKERDN